MLRTQFESAIAMCENLHSSNISHDHLDIFTRVARENPDEIGQVIDILLKNIDINRNNTTSSIYCLIKLADISNETKNIIKNKIDNDFINFYSKDNNEEISNNTKILEAVLNGQPLSNFKDNTKTNDNSSVSTIYNLNNSNLAVNSPSTSQTINIENIDEDIKAKIYELKNAIINKDKVTIGETFTYIADKAVNVVIALLTQQIRF